ncbi:MAG TPA: glycosyl hydrolase, partial [Pyrinomonadaceae bacterium]|nr:glycosyl hydrolase [Pyrinomonadaceae bacterium]
MVLLIATCPLVSSAPIDDLQRSFFNPPDNSRIMMRWWWFGPAVTKAELEREMRLMKEGGIGGFEVQPVYPLVLDNESAGIKTLPFLSDEFLDALRFTSDKARELGLRFDLTLGSGWPFGGPTVSIDHAAGRLRYEHIKVDAATKFVKVPSIGAGEKFIAAFLA